MDSRSDVTYVDGDNVDGDNDPDKELDWFNQQHVELAEEGSDQAWLLGGTQRNSLHTRGYIIGPTARACVTFRSSVSICSLPRVRLGLLRN